MLDVIKCRNLKNVHFEKKGPKVKKHRNFPFRDYLPQFYS